jgi:hypothetical protein
MWPISSTKLTGLAGSGTLKKPRRFPMRRWSQALSRAIRDKEKMDKLFGVPAAKTLGNIGGNRDGCAPHLKSPSILFILRPAVHK